jgi:hypothetical protein
MPDLPDDLAGLERRRAELYEQLSQVGDFRRGTLRAVRRKCGRPNCACVQPEHPGHGPQYNLSRSVGGRTVTRHLKPGPELQKVTREVAEYERFRALVGEVTEVNEEICEARPVTPSAGGQPPVGAGGEKGGLVPSSPRRSRRRPPPR